MKRMFLILTLLFHAHQALASIPPAARESQYDEYEGLDLAQALFNDGKFDDAEVILNSHAGDQPARAAKLAGAIEMARGNLKRALSHLDRAHTFAKADLSIHLMRGEIFSRQKFHRECASAYAAAGDSIFSEDRHSIMKAGCEGSLGRKVDAWKTLFAAERKLSTLDLVVARIRLMTELGLNHEAFRAGLAYLARADANASGALTIAELQGTNALNYLETARLRFPTDVDLRLAVIPLYYEKGMTISVAETFERVSWKIKKYAYHAAEIYRQKGDLQKAYWLNLQVPEEKERLRQKLALLVDRNRWDLVASMETPARWTKSDTEDEIHYALAFSLARFGQITSAQNYASKVRGPALIPKATALAQLLRECETAGWACRQ